ncbi:glycosyltransferase [Lacinutrix undariae]
MTHVLIIGIVWPEPKSSAAGSRMMQLINLFLAQDYKVTFATATAKSDNAFDLESIGVAEVAIALNSERFDAFASELNPNIVVFDRFMIEEQFGWRIAEYCPNALRILDTEDLHALRRGRQQAFKDQVEFDDSYLFNDTAKREIASIYRCDLSLIISEVEMDLLKTKFKVDESLLHYLPFMQQPIDEVTVSEFPDFEARAHFVTIGNFFHEPNYNMVLYLKNIIWPLIKAELPKAELHIYGAYASQKVTQLHNKKERFIIKGFAESVDEVMKNARVCVAPIRFGAGLKGKLFDAMKNGIPYVTTAVGAEGIAGAESYNDPQEFANQAILLYKEHLLWKNEQEKGVSVVNEGFDITILAPLFLERIATLKKNLNAHRMANFTGQILQHHSLQSTKYMSKWIEVKNKL